MIKIKTKSKGNNFGGIFDVYLTNIDAKLIPAIRALISQATADIVKDTKISMKQQKSGRFYSYRGRRYQASARGETPAVRSGTLFRSLNRQVFEAPGGIIGTVKTEVPYGKYLIKADRPIFNPAFAQHKLLFVRNLKRKIQDFAGAKV